MPHAFDLTRKSLINGLEAAAKAPFISKRDSLLVEETWDHAGDGFTETTHRNFHTIETVLSCLGDNTIRLIRFDRQRLTGKDITEQMAIAWLERHGIEMDGDGDPDRSVMPRYVADSDALERAIGNMA